MIVVFEPAGGAVCGFDSDAHSYEYRATLCQILGNGERTGSAMVWQEGKLSQSQVRFHHQTRHSCEILRFFQRRALSVASGG